MPQVTGIGTIWNQPNYAGELFTADPTQTPLLSMIGGLSGGKQTDNFEFATNLLYDLPAATQPAITEQASITGATSSFITRSQEKNVVQIFQEGIDISYVKQSNTGRMSGLNTAGQQANPKDELAWQIEQKLVKVARDVEFTFINGKYQISTASNVANKTRGLLELCENSSTIDAAGAKLNQALLKTLFREMADNGAFFDNMVLLCNSFQKQTTTDIYEKQLGYNVAAQRNVGGMNITELETDFFKMGVVWDRFVPEDTILIADIKHVAPVFQAVPGKGILFVEEKPTPGASEHHQLFGQIGLAHGPAFLHGSITGLATS